MALSRTQSGAAHEVWVETDPTTFTGVSPPVVIVTDIRTTSDELNSSRIRLYLHNVAGVPVVLPPIAAVVPVPTGGWNVLQVQFQNTSGNPADQAAWKLEVERIWSGAR